MEPVDDQPALGQGIKVPVARPVKLLHPHSDTSISAPAGCSSSFRSSMWLSPAASENTRYIAIPPPVHFCNGYPAKTCGSHDSEQQHLDDTGHPSFPPGCILRVIPTRFYLACHSPRTRESEARFTRKREHAVAFKAMLRRRGVRVVSITEQADDTPTGKLLEAIIESVDEFYSENLVRGFQLRLNHQ